MTSLVSYIVPVLTDPASVVVHFYTPSIFSVPSEGSASIYVNVFPSSLLFGYYGFQMGVGENKLIRLLKVHGVSGELQFGFAYPVYFDVVLPMVFETTSGTNSGYAIHVAQSASFHLNKDASLVWSLGWYSSYLNVDLSSLLSSISSTSSASSNLTLPVSSIEVDESSVFLSFGALYHGSSKGKSYLLAFYAPQSGRVWFSLGLLRKFLNLYLNVYPESPLELLGGFSLRFEFR